jgi:hypothetical protein
LDKAIAGEIFSICRLSLWAQPLPLPPFNFPLMTTVFWAITASSLI